MQPGLTDALSGYRGVIRRGVGIEGSGFELRGSAFGLPNEALAKLGVLFNRTRGRLNYLLLAASADRTAWIRARHPRTFKGRSLRTDRRRERASLFDFLRLTAVV
jgi:hypothetical protein